MFNVSISKYQLLIQNFENTLEVKVVQAHESLSLESWPGPKTLMMRYRGKFFLSVFHITYITKININISDYPTLLASSCAFTHQPISVHSEACHCSARAIFRHYIERAEIKTSYLVSSQ